MILAPKAAFVFDHLRPLNYQRVGDSTGVSLLLVSLEGCVSGHRPTERVVRISHRTTELVDELHIHLSVFGNLIEVQTFIERAGLSAFLTRTIVGDKYPQSPFTGILPS